jgi:hypothetical protein
MYAPMSNDDKIDWRGWLPAFALALATAVFTAGANAVGEELKARWKAQREKKDD